MAGVAKPLEYVELATGCSVVWQPFGIVPPFALKYMLLFAHVDEYCAYHVCAPEILPATILPEPSIIWVPPDVLL